MERNFERDLQASLTLNRLETVAIWRVLWRGSFIALYPSSSIDDRAGVDFWVGRTPVQLKKRSTSTYEDVLFEVDHSYGRVGWALADGVDGLVFVYLTPAWVAAWSHADMHKHRDYIKGQADCNPRIARTQRHGKTWTTRNVPLPEAWCARAMASFVKIRRAPQEQQVACLPDD